MFEIIAAKSPEKNVRVTFDAIVIFYLILILT